LSRCVGKPSLHPLLYARKHEGFVPYTYRELADKQIIPHLGPNKLQKLEPEHVQHWHGTLLGLGLSPRAVGHALGFRASY
jgi:Phage integrase, N-terminal SAM-like domain